MKLNLYTNANGHKLIDTANTPDSIFRIEPVMKEGVGRDLYPRIVNITFGKDSVDVDIKLPSGFSAKFVESAGHFFIEPIDVSYHSQCKEPILNFGED